MKIFIIEEKTFETIDINDSIFDSLRGDYPCFTEWFQKKQKEKMFTVTIEDKLSAVLYLKVEDSEQDKRIEPEMNRNKKLKIGTFKVQREGIGIGKEFMRLALLKAKESNVDEIYFTVHDKFDNHKKFISFIQNYGFTLYGYKGQEKVFVKSLC